MKKILFLVFSFLFSFFNLISAQTQTNTPTTDQPIPQLSEHSPQKALLLSILPGAGQVYNGQAWKIPIIYGAFTTMGYFIHTNYSNMKTFKDEYLFRIDNGTPRLEGYESYPNSSIYNLYQSYNKNFQLMVIISAAIYGLNLIDAYVFGHLYDFQINDDLTLHLSPQFSILNSQYATYTVAPAMQISLTF